MTNNNSSKAKPPARITVNVNGESREIFMSFAMVNTLAGLVGDIEGYGESALSNVKREQIMLYLLAPVDPKTKRPVINDEMDIFSFEVSLEDSMKLFDWAMEHISDFLFGTAEKLKDLMKKQLPLVSEMQETVNQGKSSTPG